MGERSSELAERIFERSKREAIAAFPDQLDSDYDTMWIACAKRSSAMSFYAYEYGCRFIDVRALRIWFRVDLAAIRDRAREMAAEGDGSVAYTWDGEGWLYERCKRTDEGAIAFWECSERPRATPQGEPRRLAPSKESRTEVPPSPLVGADPPPGDP